MTLLSFIAVFVVLSLCFVVSVDAESMVWSKTYGGADDDEAYSLVATSDGGYALAGYINMFDNENGTLRIHRDFWLVKTDAHGSTAWSKTYGGRGYDWAYSLVATSDGGYAIAGNNRPTEMGHFLREYDTLLVKMDEFGNMEWIETYEGTGRNIFVRSLVVASDDGIVLAGSIKSFGVGDRDFWLVKTDGCMCPYECNTYEYDYLFGYFTYAIVVHSNSTIENFNFDIQQKQISFNVTGPNQTTGFCEIVIPKILLDGGFPVYMNGEPMIEGVDYTQTANSTHATIRITYSHSTHRVEITGTHAIPELSACTATTIVLAATTAIVIYKRKRPT
jgi:hypothetical protein